MITTSASTIDWVARFERAGRKTEVWERDGLRYYVNEYWTSKQRDANGIHEISYRACFKPQLPAFFIENLTEPGDVVYDPFMGRGTTPIQSALSGRVPYGIDVNPLCAMFTRPRLNPPTLKAVADRLAEIPLDDDLCRDLGLLTFFHPVTLSHIVSLQRWFRNQTASGEFDHVDDWVRMVALNRLTGHSSGFFSVYTLPPNQATSVKNQARINERRRQRPTLRDVKALIEKKSASLLRHSPVISDDGAIVGTGPAWATPQIESSSVDLIVTSPPFLDVVNYKSDNWLRCWFADIGVDSVNISTHRTLESWTSFVRDCFVEFGRVVRPGGHVVFEVGEVRNGTIWLERHVAEAVHGLPFALLGVIVNQQEFTKTSNVWGVDNNRKGTNSNRIVLLRRH